MKTFLCALFGLSLATFAAAPPPDNDNFANRTALVASGSIAVTARNASATTQASEPTISGDVVTKSVWWSWTAPFDGPVTINTTSSSFDTLLGVFTGTALGALSSIAENDDFGGLFTSSVAFNAVGGVPYVILVGGYNGAAGKVRLAITTAGAPCSYALSPASRSVAYTAGQSTVSVTTTTGCTWSALSNDSWLTVTAGSSGSGSGTVSYSIAANTALTARTGTLTVAGLTHTVVQAAAPACTYSISPASASVSASPITNSFVMTAGTGCAWTATPNASWLTIQSGASGTGNGTTTYVVATNSLSNTRVGTITVAGLTHTVTQAGTVPCTYSISPTSAPFTSTGGSSNIVISTLTACAWTASSPVSWVTFSTTNGTGNGTVNYSVAANASTVARSTTLTVAGNSFAVTQSGAPCTYALSPASASVSSGASSGTTAVTAGVGCAWTAVSNDTWLTITSGSSGSGNGTVSYSIAANPNTAIRVGTLTIGGQTFTVTQAAAPCSFSIAPTAAHYSDTTATGSIAVTAGTGCAWTAVSNDAFIMVNSGTPGSGNGTVGYTVAANVTTSSRTGTITVAGSTFTVTQDGTTPCSYGITPSSASYTSGGGSSSVAVTANTGCTWSASSAASWVMISTSSGSGNGTVPYTVAVNTSSLPRNGTLTIAGNPFTVSQSGAPCVFAISPTSSSFSYTGGSGSVTVTATSGCAWTSSSDSSWLTATNGASGTGNGTLIYSVAASTAVTNRTGRLTIAGKLLTVTQTAAPCVFAIDPVSYSSAATGGGGTITITASDNACAWTASESQTWLSLSATSGIGSGSVAFTVSPTTQTNSRTANITIAGATFPITQDGDSTVPTVTLTAPSNGSTISNVVLLSATASDDVSVSRVDFYRNSAVFLGTDTTTPYAVSYNTTNVANGSHTFYARAFDQAGNQGLSTTNTVTVTNGASTNTQWALGFGGAGTDDGRAVAVDQSSGAVVAAGYFVAPTDFGGGVLTNAGGNDIFVAKYSGAGAFAWARRFGQSADDSASGVAIDSSGNVFVTGYFSGTVDFGGGALVSVGGLDIFLLKLDSSGAHVWSKSFGGSIGDTGNGVTVDSSGNVIFTGSFNGTVDFGGGALTSVGYNTVTAKFSNAGVFAWAKTFSSTGDDIGNSVAADGSGNVTVAGQFIAGINLGGGVVFSVGGFDGYVVGFNSSGTYVWSRVFGTASSDFATGVATDSSGNVFLTGYFKGTVNLGGASFTSGSAGAFNSFLARYSSTGVHSWSKQFAGSLHVYSYGLAVDAGNSVLAIGQFQGTATFSGSSVTSLNSPLLDVFLVKYSNTGTLAWVKSFGGNQSDSGNATSADASNNVFSTGQFRGSGSFAGITLTAPTSLDPNIFLMRTAP